MTAAQEFERWWHAYPRKVGKLAAIQAYVKARKLASAEELLAGVGRYIENKPPYADWAHPKTWLGQGRWMDEPDGRSSQDRRSAKREEMDRRLETWAQDCPHAPKCSHYRTCWQRQELDAVRAAS